MHKQESLYCLQEVVASCLTCARQVSSLCSSGKRSRALSATSCRLLLRRAAQLLRQRRHGHQAHTQGQQG